MLYTIGYEGATLQGFLNVLKNSPVRILLDVRAVPISRKSGFSKNALRENLEGIGVEYQHLGKSLGNPKEGRLAAWSGDTKRFKQIFTAHMRTRIAKDGIETACLLAKETNLCLLCFEREHHLCHRSIVADKITKKLNIKVEHLQSA